MARKLQYASIGKLNPRNTQVIGIENQGSRSTKENPYPPWPPSLPQDKYHLNLYHQAHASWFS